MIKTYIKATFIAILMATLTGCAGMNGDFSCNAKAGDSCMPVDTVNAQANAGTYNFNNTGAQGDAHTFSYANRSGSNSSDGYQGTTPQPGQPVRYGESVQRVWIAPYQDNSNNYHEPSYVYTVIKKPHWVGVPAREVKGQS